ncbi:hypothetical protein L9F63_006652, partial [Diploptera punctata]
FTTPCLGSHRTLTMTMTLVDSSFCRDVTLVALFVVQVSHIVLKQSWKVCPSHLYDVEIVEGIMSLQLLSMCYRGERPIHNFKFYKFT